MAHRFTVGVEEEFQIVDPQTCELRSHVSELLASSAPALGEQIKREMHQSIVEVGTRICHNVPELREEIFEPFRQGPSSAAHSPGVGIGLSLVARFTELHSGHAWVEEREGGGASFRVFLPTEPAPGLAARPVEG